MSEQAETIVKKVAQIVMNKALKIRQRNQLDSVAATLIEN